MRPISPHLEQVDQQMKRLKLYAGVNVTDLGDDNLVFYTQTATQSCNAESAVSMLSGLQNITPEEFMSRLN